MKMRMGFGLLVLLGFGLIVQSCEEEKEGGNEQKISQIADMESHNVGENCMSCHLAGGEGEGWFTVAGSVYDESKTAAYPNAKVFLYSEANAGGDLKYTVEVDGRGNFYTTESIDFGSGLYATVEGSETSKNMITPITSGACNSCHSGSDNRIWVK